VTELEDALTGGAVDLGEPGLDGTYGHGRLDVPGAIARLDRIRGQDALALGGLHRR
jgi:hypothetical protein